jgi:rhodanese-related sulfurtransferase
MHYKRFVGAILVVTILLCGMFVSCGPASGGGGAEFEVIRQAADAYLSSGKASVTIHGLDLNAILSDDDPTNDPRVLSVRDNKHYSLGHICGAHSAPWRQLFITLTPDRLDKWFTDQEVDGITWSGDNKQIVVYSYTGQEGSGQTTAFLNMLGWDAINLQWGFTVWMFCPNASPGAFCEASTGLGVVIDGVGFNAVGQNYKTETTVNEATEEYPFPVVENTSSEDEFEIIRAAAAAWALSKEPLPANYQGSKTDFYEFTDPDILPKEVFTLLTDTNRNNDPFILSVQEAELYAKGHVPGAIHIPLTDVAKPENLHKLPTDRQIVVVSTDGQSGSQVAGILRLLGYEATNLLFGMTGWTYDEEVAPGRFHIWADPGRVTFKDVLDLPICWIDLYIKSNVIPIPPDWEPPVYDVPEEEEGLKEPPQIWEY